MPPIRCLRHSPSIIRATKSYSASLPQKTPSCRSSRRLIAEHAGVQARLLIGDERISSNPKLNNVLKGWAAAAHDWIIIADSNVLMPPNYIQRLFASWRDDTGLVASPPVGCRPARILGRARMRVPQYLSGALAVCRRCARLRLCSGQDHAVAARRSRSRRRNCRARQGSRRRRRGDQSRPRRRSQSAAGRSPVRATARSAHAQPRSGIGKCAGRGCAAPAFLLYFLPEILSGGVLPMIAVAIVAHGLGLPVDSERGSCSVRSGMAARCCLPRRPDGRCPRCRRSTGSARDLLLPALFVSALRGNDFVWRGNEMQVERMRPRRAIARDARRACRRSPKAAAGGCARCAPGRCQRLTA